MLCICICRYTYIINLFISKFTFLAFHPYSLFMITAKWPLSSFSDNNNSLSTEHVDLPGGRRSTLGGLTDAFNNIHLNLSEETGNTSLDSFACHVQNNRAMYLSIRNRVFLNPAL